MRCWPESQRNCPIIPDYGTNRLVFLVLAGLLNSSALSFAGDFPYLQELMQRARQERLADRPEWRALLHYKPRLLGPGVESLVDAESFFNSPVGKSNPEAELEATLASFFVGADGRDQHPQCRFIARYTWLKRALNFDSERLPERRCAAFQRWFSRFSPQQLTLIFPAAYLNNPASMFGHTLLRLDAKGQDERTRLLAYTVNFAARTDEERGLTFAAKGLFGGYPGRFSIAPYYLKVKEYGDIENRDIWEYQLNFTPDEIERLLQHVWEFQSAYFDYFFLDENCAYHLLALLEVARPTLKLTDQFRWWAVPADTVRAVTETPGLLKGVVFRPARSTLLKRRLTRMDGTLEKLTKQLALGRLEPEADAIERLPPVAQAQALELAIDYLAYRETAEPRAQEGIDRLSLMLLQARNQIDAPSQAPFMPAPKVRPDQGHESARIGFGYGFEEPGSFLQFEFRPGYHDLLDPEGGYTRGAKIQFFNTVLRAHPDDGKVELERFDAIDLISLSPWNRFMRPFSWKVNLGAVRKRFDDGERALVGRLNPGIGVSYELPGNSLVYAFAEGSLEVSDRFEPVLAAGIGPAWGILHDVSERWRISLSGRSHHLFLGERRSVQEIALGQRVSLLNQSAVRFDLSWTHEFDEDFLSGYAALLLYF